MQSMAVPTLLYIVGAYRPTAADDAVLGSSRWPNMSVTFDGKGHLITTVQHMESSRGTSSSGRK
jgi:hypothetical protein